MVLNRWKTTCVAALFAAGVLAAGATVVAYQNDGPVPTDVAAEPGPTAVSPSPPDLVTVNGTVLMPDGAPAAGAIVKSVAERDEAAVARTDASGRFQLRGGFDNGGLLHVRSEDGDHQTTLAVPSLAVRTAFAAPIELKLTPALTQIVAVEAAGRPVAGAHVVAMGLGYKVYGVTGRNGLARLQLPARGNLQELVAWHPESGVNGLQDTENGLPRGTTRLSLLPPRPHRVRAVDPGGKPIAGLVLTISVKTENSNWILMGALPVGRVRTDADGTATLPWVPRERLEYVDIKVLGSDWKIDETDLTRIAEGITTIHARPERSVEGHLVMPEGASAEGILITGFGFGPANQGVSPSARARRDGTFTLRVPSDHAFVLGVSDLKWASDPWSGVIVGRDGWEPSEITLNVYPATPLTVRVTRGPRRDPVADAWVHLTSRGKVTWTDAQGKKRTGDSGARAWMTTDAEGLVRAGVGRGEQQLRLSSGRWSEEREVKVTSGEPAEVEFHRPWQGERLVKFRLMRDGARYEPSPTLVARAWTPQSPYLPLQFDPRARPDGTFEVAFDAGSLSLYFLDRAKQRGGFARIGLEDAPVDVIMETTASYGGTLLDEQGQPLADRTLKLVVKTSPYEAVAPQRTDKAGRFRFAVVPAGVPLELTIRNEGDGAKYFLFDRDRLFRPDEVRENDRVTPHRRDAPSPIAHPPIPLAERVEKLCRDAGPSGMHALVLLQGDDSQDVVTLADRLLGEDRVKAVYSYLTLRLDAGRLKAEAAVVADRGWPRPGPGEVVLVALNGDQATIAASRVAAGERDAAFGFGKDFLERHRPPVRNARALLAEARTAAKESGRRVWVVQGGPRCGPCFRLARWMADHHTTLEKDYVIVKLMEGVDDHVEEVIAKFPVKPGDGVPWFAITEPDGSLLATSESPLGNIGFPDSVEGVRHLRQMLDRSTRKLTSDELDSLMKSLSPQP
ncbi:hypothetical protein SAMN05444166_3800 [Singulisphaera sp. GP187]|uniref:thioredoxin family protein n=1 Tax=Singulisphaera sp. GP187 TaxID=1882752 RepID=UPI00092B07B5|nr:thioredoxin family protein [Singulisphaera sp. GP187]SIO32579.1 hypothetical protein SAMN05444166_3800 [Singulisphaera sp. GP187]